MHATAQRILDGAVGDAAALAENTIRCLVPETVGALVEAGSLYRASIRAKADRILAGDRDEYTIESLCCDVQSEAAWGGRW